ncbi:hypothetical protein [Actinophytocola sp.]|jgi:hypothetical protein|nr:hypothetical protein [Actinophytocola sp.]HYQ61680.1 hypothetical protein [Actinophytocola sp.]
MSEDCLPPAARLVVAPSMRGATTVRTNLVPSGDRARHGICEERP